MRFSGALAEHDSLAGADHLCWVYADPGSFVDAAGRFLADGVARNERLLCVGDGLAGQFRAAGEPFGPIDELVSGGALDFQHVGSIYERCAHDGRVLQPEQQRDLYDTAVRDARAAGYSGLRVVADVTALAVDAASRAQLVHWEHLADEYIAGGSGMVAMCGYARPSLTDAAVSDVATVHPQVHAPRDIPSFRLWFDGGRMTLAGTVDTFGADRLARALACSPVRDRRVVLDLSALEVVDVAGCRALARWAGLLADQGARLELAGAPRIVERIWRLVGLSDMAPVTFARGAA